MSGNSGLSFLDGQADPIVFLLTSQLSTNQELIEKQASDSQILEDASVGAASAINDENAYLTFLANAMSGDNSNDGSMTSASTEYNVQQQIAGNKNGAFNTGIGGDGTVESDDVPVQQFTLQIVQSTVDFENGVDQCVKGWAS